jgi:hypothetical protein
MHPRTASIIARCAAFVLTLCAGVALRHLPFSQFDCGVADGVLIGWLGLWLAHDLPARDA